jgi:pSer/pThr/pTyr-binding forkhead associated (FHA) protein
MRDRCIQACSASVSVKMMMHRAFEAGTDTSDLWGLLQMNCLLEPQKQEATGQRPSPLTRRSTGEPESAARVTGAVPAPSSATRVTARRPARERRPVQRVVVEEAKETIAPSRHYLIPQEGRHRIALAEHGEIVLGRFDPLGSENPDVDLTYDDRTVRGISRRHARIIAHDDLHEIEDLGSTNGTMVNGKRLEVGLRVPLRLGDRVTLGRHEFFYRSVPGVRISPYAPPLAYLWVTFTGYRFPLPTSGEVLIGRRDLAVGFIPDIDLSEEGDVAEVVSRRHVKVIARDGRHYVEDLGSANGTKLNGAVMKSGETGLLEPGDHLWLGGCVLAYDYG